MLDQFTSHQIAIQDQLKKQETPTNDQLVTSVSKEPENLLGLKIKSDTADDASHLAIRKEEGMTEVYKQYYD